MIKIIEQLKEQRVKAEKQFIKNSLIKRSSLTMEVPDVETDLDNIAELNEAISVLETHTMQKPLSNN